MARLAKVADPEALDAADGPRARMEIVVQHAWLRDGADVEVTAPRLLACDRCDGGGCDACDRSGAYRLGDARTLSLSLQPDTPTNVVVRVPAPFEGIDQLLVHVKGGDEPSSGVRRINALAPRPPQGLPNVAIAAIVAAIIAVVVLLLRS